MTDKKDIEAFFQDIPLKKITGIEIFKAGPQTDSKGREKEWTTTELRQIVRAFNAGRPALVHVKLGHTSEEHNDLVAKELNIPSSILSGEGETGHGAASLGKITGISVSGTTLIAEMEVPESIAHLVKSGLFAHVSSEISEDYQGKGPALSGLALLGAERPALKDLKGLESATIHAEEDLVYIFSMGEGMEFVKTKEEKKRKKSSKPYTEIVDLLHEESIAPSIEEIFSMLGIASIDESQRYTYTSDQVHHFIFRSGRAKDSPEVIYQVPITETETTQSGTQSRKVIVQHVRASTISEARGVAFSALQSVLGAFGAVLGTGLAGLTLLIIQEKLGLRQRFRYDVGSPTVVSNPSSKQRKSAESVQRDLTARIIQGKGRVFQDPSDRADFVAVAIALKAAVQLPFLVIGAVTLKNVAFDVIARNQEKNQVRPVRVYVDTVEQVEPKVKEHLGPDWGLVGKIGIAVGLQSLKDSVNLSKLGFSGQVDLIHNFVSLRVVKTGTQQGAGNERFINYALLDATTQRAIGSAMVTHFPDQKELVIDWIEGALGLDGVRKFIRTMKIDFPDVKRVLGVRASGAKQGLDFPQNLLAIKMGERADQLHAFAIPNDTLKAVTLLEQAREVSSNLKKGIVSVSEAAAEFGFLKEAALKLNVDEGFTTLWQRVNDIVRDLRSEGFDFGMSFDVDALHQFHKVNAITRRPVKPHSHGKQGRGQRISSVLGTAKGAFDNPRARATSKAIVRKGIKIGIRRRFFVSTVDSLAESLRRG